MPSQTEEMLLPPCDKNGLLQKMIYAENKEKHLIKNMYQKRKKSVRGLEDKVSEIFQKVKQRERDGKLLY